MERTVRVIRDLLAIVIMGVVVVVGFIAVKTLYESREPKPAVVQTPPLPVDKCGGGLCDAGRTN